MKSLGQLIVLYIPSVIAGAIIAVAILGQLYVNRRAPVDPYGSKVKMFGAYLIRIFAFLITFAVLIFVRRYHRAVGTEDIPHLVVTIFGFVATGVIFWHLRVYRSKK